MYLVNIVLHNLVKIIKNIVIVLIISKHKL